MLELLYRIFVGHNHKWEIVSRDNMHGSRNGDDLPLGTKYTLQCKHCGKIKHYTNY